MLLSWQQVEQNTVSVQRSKLASQLHDMLRLGCGLLLFSVGQPRGCHTPAAGGHDPHQ
jgi:hypothetical protein